MSAQPGRILLGLFCIIYLWLVSLFQQSLPDAASFAMAVAAHHLGGCTHCSGSLKLMVFGDLYALIYQKKPHGRSAMSCMIDCRVVLLQSWAMQLSLAQQGCVVGASTVASNSPGQFWMASCSQPCN